MVAGRAEPGARVALLDGGETLLETQAHPQTGEFVFMPPRLGAGAHNLSVRSAPSAEGGQPMETAVQAFSIAPQVRARTSASATSASTTSAATTSASATSANATPGPAVGPVKPATTGGKAIIARGDTLWRISRDKLGRGALYPTIVQANSPKIRNPNLIYPAQTLIIP